MFLLRNNKDNQHFSDEKSALSVAMDTLGLNSNWPMAARVWDIFTSQIYYFSLAMLYIMLAFILQIYLLSCWTQICPAFANSADPDQLASEEANWSGSALFVIQYMNLYQQPGSSTLIGWQLEVGVAS